MSVRKPHTSEIRAAHPYLKKVECPPPAYRDKGTCITHFICCFDSAKWYKGAVNELVSLLPLLLFVFYYYDDDYHQC